VEELKKQRGDEEGSLFKDLALLIKWPSLNEEEKNDQYSKHSCHELNIYVYFKDRDYFKKVVLPHLRNKMEKTFIDHYLLGNFDEISKHYELSKLHRLNALEQCLLIDALLKTGKKEEAKTLQVYIEQLQQRSKIAVNTANTMFDIVLNMNNLKKDTPPISEDGGSSLDSGLMDMLPPCPPPPGGPPPPQFQGLR